MKFISDIDVKLKIAYAGVFVVLFFLFLLSFYGCINKDAMSPKKLLTGIYDQYNTQYSDYMYQTGFVKEQGAWVKRSSPELSETQKNVLRKKKDILVKVHPLIILYDNLINTGGDIPPTLMPQIITLLNQLLII